MKKYQYEKEKLGYGSTVKAKYIKIGIKEYDDNPFIAALPNPELSGSEILDNYTRNIDTKSLKNLPPEKRRQALNGLLSLRVPLPFQEPLERLFINSLRNSYHSRMIMDVCTDDKIEKALVANPIEGTNSGFVLLGCSGSGKSSAVKLMLDHWPQVIEHENINGMVRMKQIVYLIVSCQPNSNFSALYQGIAREIDRALCTDEYEKMITVSHKSLAEKQKIIERLIERFAIGSIIFDEIQLINFNSSKENSFEALTVMANTTKVAISAIGTEETYEYMFSQMRNARRTANLIEADRYCSDLNYFAMIVKSLFKFQFFDKKLVLTKELIKSFYEETGGIVCLAVMLYMRVCDEYLSDNESISLTPEVVRKIAKKYFKTLEPLVNYGLSNKELEEQIDDIKELINKQKAISEFKSSSEAILNAQEEFEHSQMIEQAISYIKEEYDYKEDAIRKACEDVMGKNSINSAVKLAMKAVDILKTKKKHKSNGNGKNKMEFSLT